MKDMRTVLKQQLALYPGMELEDVVKLLYQSEFGGGHYIAGPAAFAAALHEERNLFEMRSMPAAPPEEIGGGYARVHLSGLEQGPSDETLAKLCVLSAQGNRGSEEGLINKLKLVCEMIEQGALPLSAGKWNDFLDDYGEAGYPLSHHSARYKALYRPHYRVLDSFSALALPVFAAVDRAIAQKTHVLLGIDGMSTSGKSTLAALLQAVYGCGVVHSDDFFLRAPQRTPHRMQQPGGNIDYERLAPVARQAADDRAFSYLPYNCQTGATGEERHVPSARLTVLEGAYSLHPKVDAPCDLRIFLTVDAAVQRPRAEKRNPRQASRFLSEWIPMENEYFAAFSIREGCDVVVDTTGLGV